MSGQISFKKITQQDFTEKSQSLAGNYQNYSNFRVGCSISDSEINKSYMLTEAYTNYFFQYEEYLKEQINKKLKNKCCSGDLKRYFSFYKNQNCNSCCNNDIIKNCTDGLIEW